MLEMNVKYGLFIQNKQIIGRIEFEEKKDFLKKVNNLGN